MRKNIFILLQSLINLLRGLLYPLSVEVISAIIPACRKRRDFELLNNVDPLSRSFALDGLVAEFTFQVSSEGELEQVKPLIFELLRKSYKIELVYTSESVEKKCQALACEYKDSIRLFRMPLLTFFFFNIFKGQNLGRWMTSRRLVLCRYDFFPELLLIGAQKRVSFFLVSGTLKNKENLRGPKRWHYKVLYRLFDHIVCASEADVDRFRKLGIRRDNLSVFDFRIMQIEKRARGSETVLSKVRVLELLTPLFEKVEKSKRLVLGSAWPIEMALFDNKEFLSKIATGDIAVLVAPHKLGKEYTEKMYRDIEGFATKHGVSLPIHSFSGKENGESFDAIRSDIANSCGVIMLTVPGVLCELYSFFGHSFIGGGHGRSIHSVLEPFVSKSNVLCGPKTHRSTEFDFVESFDAEGITVVNKLEEFYPILRDKLNFKLNGEKHGALMEEYPVKFEKVFEIVTHGI